MSSTALAHRARITGPTLPWARDGLLIGGAAGLLAPAGGMVLLACLGPGLITFTALGSYALVTGVLGAGSGLLLGAMTPAVLERVRGRLPLWLLGAGALLLGAAWGGAVGAAGASILAGTFEASVVNFAATGAILGGLAGAVLLGLCWLPYTVQAVLGRRRWPIVAAVVLLAPLVGAGVLLGLLALLA